MHYYYEIKEEDKINRNEDENDKEKDKADSSTKPTRTHKNRFDYCQGEDYEVEMTTEKKTRKYDKNKNSKDVDDNEVK